MAKAPTPETATATAPPVNGAARHKDDWMPQLAQGGIVILNQYTLESVHSDDGKVRKWPNQLKESWDEAQAVANWLNGYPNGASAS